MQLKRVAPNDLRYMPFKFQDKEMPLDCRGSRTPRRRGKGRGERLLSLGHEDIHKTPTTPQATGRLPVKSNPET